MCKSIAIEDKTKIINELKNQYDELNELKSKYELMLNNFICQKQFHLAKIVNKILKLQGHKVTEVSKEEISKEEISKEEKEELKKIFRKISKKIHPDLVAPELKIKAEEIFKNINEAKQNNDLKSLIELASQIESCDFSFNDYKNKEKNEEFKIIELEQKIIKIKIEIDLIEKNEDFKRVSAIIDLDEYFATKKKELKRTLNTLKVKKGEKNE